MKYYIIFSIIVLLHNARLIAQDTVRGHVYEQENGKLLPLIGVNVYWAETIIGTSTDETGHFTLIKNDNTALLVFSFVSYVNDTLDISNLSKENRANNAGAIHVVMDAGQELREIEVTERSTSFHSSLEAAQMQKITGAELQKAACCNLSESFETNASVDVSYGDAVTGAKQIELLGLAGKYSQILAEKLPNVRGLSATYGLEYIPGSWMDGIAISKGTSSVIDGFESITGQINIEYKKPDDGELFYFNTLGNSIGKIEANLNGRLTIGILEKWTTAILLHGENNSLNHDFNDDNFIDHPKIRQYNFMNRWKFNPSEKFAMQAGIKMLDERRIGGQNEYDGTKAGLEDNYGVLINTVRFEGFLKGGYILKKPHTSIGFLNSYTLFDQESYVGHNEYLARQDAYYGNLIYQSIIANTNHKYSTGFSLLYDNYDETFNDSLFSRVEYVPGAFFQYTYNHLDKAIIMLGVRADYNNIYGAFFTPRANVKYNFPRKVILRISAGKGTRTPNVFAENSYLLASSRELRIVENIEQEEAWNYGINISKTFTFLSQELTLYSEFYRTDFINQMVVDLDSDASAILISNLDGKSYSNIAQIEIQYKPLKGLEIVGAYRWSDVKTTISGILETEPITNDYKALFTASYLTPKKKWQFDFTSQFNGGGRLPENHPEDRYDPFTILNAQITRYFKIWEIYIGGENLTGFVQENPILSGNDPYSDSFDASTVWGPIIGRKFYVGIKLRIDKKKIHLY